MIKRYTQFVNEADDANIDETPGVKSLDSSKFTELKDEVKKMVDNTITKSGGEFASFI